MKSYTDISQSKKLTEILPIESADMRYGYIAPYDFSDRMYDGGYDDVPYPKDFLKRNPNFSENEYDGELPCWSLAALYQILPNTEHISTTLSRGGWKIESLEYANTWWCEYEDENDPTRNITKAANNPVDVCYEMILELHNLL